jgi:rare lipoprotein A
MIERALRACVSPRVWGTLALAALLQSTANVSTAQAFPERGIASITWLPSKTACGGRFNPKAMAAAHKTLRCGTKVLVRHSGNNKSVVVTITDRGPYRRGRIIDLTPAAAAPLVCPFGRASPM